MKLSVAGNFCWWRYALILMASVIMLPLSAQAEEAIGRVLKSQNMPNYPVGKMLMENTEIRTRANQKIAVKTRQGDVLIANQNAKIKLVKPGFFSQLFGKIFYFIAPRRDHQVRVNTSTATIGIRGTKFIVDSEQDNARSQQVSLLEGQLQLDAHDGEQFALYQQREMDEFEQYKRQMKGEFEAYKQQMMEEFVAYRSSIDLQSGYALSFDGDKVVRKPMGDHIQQEFDEFEQFVAEAKAGAGE